MAYTIPPDTRSVGSGNPPLDMDNVADVLTGNGFTAHVNNTAFAGGADPSGASDSAAAFAAAIASLPTVTAWANPNTNTGASAVYPAGRLLLGAGTYKLGSVSDIGNIGPFVSVIGPGHAGCTLAYYGAGDCLRAFNGVRPASDTFDCLVGLAGRLDGFTIDGTSAQAGACGLHYGDFEGGSLGSDLFITNFSQGTLATLPALTLGTTNTSGGTFGAGTFFWTVTAVNRSGETIGSSQVTATLVATGTQVLNWTAVTGATGYRIYRGPGALGTPNTYVAAVGAVLTYTDTGTSVYASCPPAVNTTGNTGLRFDNTVSWTENIYGRVSIRNCGNAVVFDGADGVTDTSFEYNDLTFKIYAFAGQNGVVLRNGAYFSHGSLKIRANFASSSSAQSCAALVLAGAYNGNFSLVLNSRLDVVAEINTPAAGGGSFGPMTISFSDVNHNVIQGCGGTLSFLAFGAAWTTSNWGTSTTRSNFIYTGTIQGDTALNSTTAPNPTDIGARTMSTGLAQTGGFLPLVSGDSFALTLTQNITVQLASAAAPCIAGPQHKVIAITQAASGGPYTVTWPNPGSPTLANPAVLWPGAVPRAMSAGASSVDLYTLNTVDGIHWYIGASQSSSSTLLAFNNLSDVLSAPSARANMGVGDLWLAPSGASGETFPRTYANAYLTPVTQQVYVSAIGLPVGQLASSITMIVGGTAAATVSHGWYALLDSGRVVRAVTADQTGGNWTSTFAAVTLSVAASAYTTTYSGLYYVAFCITATTLPNLVEGLTATGGVTSIAPVLCGTSGAATTTVPPALGSTLAAITAVAADRFYAYTS
jgi:hypothetical protein